MIVLFMVSLSVLLLELTFTRLFSIILWYDYAFMVISIAFFGLGIGSLLVHILKNKLNRENLPPRILQSTMAFAISIPVVLLIIGHFVPSNTSFIYIFYLSSSIPFFFAGMSVAMIYLRMPKEITKLYFIDLLGAGAAALVLDPIIQLLGAESVLLSISLILIALAGGSKNITAVELNPLIISKAKEFGKSAGNLYERKEVNVFIDDGRRFISSSNSKYDMITIKLVDSWAAQLAGGYALSENYLYTVEAFRQYLQHLDEENGMLVMVRWNIELPRLMPLIVESLRQETGKDAQEISKQMIVVENRPGLYFGANDNRTIYPVIVMLKNKPFTDTEIGLVTERVRENDAQVFVIPGVHVQPPYDKLLMTSGNLEKSEDQKKSKGQDVVENENVEAIMELKPPTDDSPFFFAREKIPGQMIILLVTVLSVSGVLALLLVYYSRMNKIHLASSSLSWLSVFFVIFIGLGFMVIEITFIQKFLLLLGTPIMALTVIVFSILVSSGMGAYLSGKLFRSSPQKGMIISIPLLITIILIYYSLLQEIINSNIALEIQYRIGLTFALLSPAGLLMGFQFPSIIRMTSFYAKKQTVQLRETENQHEDVTLLWGANVIASVIGTVLTAILSMIIGFSGNLLVGAGLYLGAYLVIIISVMRAKTLINREIIK